MSSTEPLFKSEFLPPIPPWVWVILGAAVVFARFFMVTTLSVWPNYDEGIWGYFALNFYHQWDWSLFYQDSPYPSVYFWGLGFLFKCFQPSIFVLWFYPALLSLGVVPIGYGAARQFFSKSFSFFFVLFLAFSFWPLYVGRYGDQMVLTLLVECLLFWTWGRFWKALASSRPAVWETIALGIVSVLGIYIYISGIAIAILSLLTFLAVYRKKPGRNLGSLALYLVSAFLALLPLLRAGLIQNFGRITHNIGSLSGDWTAQVQTWISHIPGYVSVLFWGIPNEIYSYEPVWGGFLDPLLGSLFFLGLTQVLRTWKNPFSRWISAAFILFFVPGILTRDLEPFRNLPLIPLLGVLCAWGFSTLFRNFSPKQSLIGLGLLTLVFGGVDFYHLTNRYHHIWDLNSTWRGYGKSKDRYHAYQILNGIRKDQGPGLIYTDFMPGPCDQTLTVADHAFNAAQNPDLSFDNARWAAVMVNANYMPFLKRRFPGGKAYFLSSDMPVPSGGQMLWMMPVTPDLQKTIAQWQSASLAYCCFPERAFVRLRENLLKAYPSFRGDPLLESCFWEKLSDLDFKAGGGKDLSRSIEDLEQGLKKGYPSAHLYHQLAVFQLLNNQIPQARVNLKRALAAPLNLTNAGELLQSIHPSGAPSASP